MGRVARLLFFVFCVIVVFEFGVFVTGTLLGLP